MLLAWRYSNLGLRGSPTHHHRHNDDEIASGLNTPVHLVCRFLLSVPSTAVKVAALFSEILFQTVGYIIKAP